MGKRAPKNNKAKRPSEADLLAFFTDIRRVIQEWGLYDDELWNMDETGVRWNAGMRHVHHDVDAGRAVVPAAVSDKRRYTAAALPFAGVVKVTAKLKHDMSGCTTVKMIAAKLGWKCELFEIEIDGVMHTRHYAWDEKSGAYFTSQTKAWMDTAGMLVYAKLTGPRIGAARKPGVTKSVLVMDHHQSHDHPLVKEAFAAYGIEGASTEFDRFPPGDVARALRSTECCPVWC